MEVIILYKDFIGWSLESIGKAKVETKYIIEYINDEKIWNKFLKTEDIDLFSRREYDNIADALTFYLTWFVNEKCYEIKMWQQIFIDNELILEEFIEPKGNVKNNIRQSVNNEMKNRMSQAERKLYGTEKSLEMYIKFINKFDSTVKKEFENFVKEYEKNEY